MQNPITTCLFLFIWLYPIPSVAQTPAPYPSEPITEAEARAFMQEFLWFSNYDRKMLSEPDERFIGFLEDSLQQALQWQDQVWYNYDLDGALIQRIDLPYIDVRTTNGMDSRNWRQVKRFRVEKKAGKMYLVPQYLKSWNSTTVSAWQETIDIPIQPATEAEKSAIWADVVAYLEHRFPEVEPVDWTREQLLGHWRIDSTYTIIDGRRVASFSLAEYLLLYDGKFYNVGEISLFYDGNFLDYPGWWGHRGKYLFLSSGIQVDLLTVEAVTPHRILLRRYDEFGPTFLILTNTPKEEITAQPPGPIEHPDVSVVLQPTYMHIGLYQDSLAEARSEQYSGLIDRTGAEWLPLIYDQLLPYNGRSFTYGQREGQWYKINAQGEEFATLPYEDFIDLMGACLLVKDKEGKVGAIDHAENVLVPFKYDMVFPQGNGYFLVTKDRKEGLVDTSGREIIPPLYDDLMRIPGDLYKVTLAGKEGILDPATGQFLLEPEYAFIYTYDRYYQAEQYDGFLLLDHQFQPVELPEYELITYLGDGYLGVEENGKRGIIDTQGEIVIPLAYENVQITSAGVLVRQGGQWRLIDWEGAEILPLDYEQVQLENELIKVKRDGRWGLLDQSGKEILPVAYDEIKLDYVNNSNEYCIVGENGKMRLINLKGEYLTAIPYDEIYFRRTLFSGSGDTWHAFEDNGKHGYLNNEGEVAIPATYDFYFFFEPSGYATVALDGKYGVIDTENNVLVPFLFDLIELQIDQPVWVVVYGGYYGLIENPVYEEP